VPESVFPVMLGHTPKYRDYQGVMSVPFQLVDDHCAQCMRNHGQTPQRLAQRGGLDPWELLAVVTDRSWREVMAMSAPAVSLELNALLTAQNRTK